MSEMWADQMCMCLGVGSGTARGESREPEEPVVAMRLIGDRVLAEWLTEAAATVVEVEEARACVVSGWEECRGERRIPERGTGEARGAVGGGQRRLTDYWEAIRRAGELFPAPLKVKKKRGKRRVAGTESRERQVERAHALFAGSKAAPL